MNNNQFKNPNNKTAHIYDLITTPLKGVEVTEAEIKLIRSILASEKNSTETLKILDIGAGTGRHAITLSNLGYKITAIDSSNEMLEVLKEKSTNNKCKIEIIVADIIAIDLGHKKYDLIIMMWNAFDEIVHTEEAALKLLEKCKSALKAGGWILINVDDSDKMDLAHINFHTENKVGKLTYRQDWKVIDFDPPAKTTTSEEIITVVDKNGTELEKYKSEIIQTWWCKESMGKLTKALNMKLEIKKIKENQEMYFVLGNKLD